MTENEILVKDLKETADVLYHAQFYKQASIVNHAADTLESFSAYEKIGTVEEFRDVMEKSTAKKPILTTKEILALINIASEWCDIMGDGDEDSCKRVDEKLDNGLGSALYKLYKGRDGQRHYEEYVKKRNRH